MFLGAVAPIIGVAVSAAGTAASISQQSAAARRQSQAIANQELIARDNLTIKKQTIEQAKIASERRFEKERAILDSQTRQARVNLEISREQAALQDLQATAQRELVGSQAQIQAAQLTAAASAQETEASNANAQQLFQLAQRFLGTDEAASQFITQFAAATGAPGLSETANAVLNEANLNDIAEFQGVREDVTTRDRVASQSANLQRQEAELVKQQGLLSTSYLESIQDMQRRANDIAFKQAEFDITNVSQQNLEAFRAANLASQSQMEIARGTADLNFRSQQAAFDAQRSSIQRPNVFGSVAQLGVQAFNAFSPSLLGGGRSSLFGSTRGPSFQSASSPSTNSRLSFGGSFRTDL